MPRAIFAVKSPHEAELPSGESLHYIHPTTGIRCGGWWVIGEAPRPDTVLVCVDATEEQLDIMAADPKYLFVADVVEELVDGQV